MSRAGVGAVVGVAIGAGVGGVVGLRVAAASGAGSGANVLITGLAGLGRVVGVAGTIETQPMTNVPTAHADTNDRITRNPHESPSRSAESSEGKWLWEVSRLTAEVSLWLAGGRLCRELFGKVVPADRR